MNTLKSTLPKIYAAFLAVLLLGATGCGGGSTAVTPIPTLSGTAAAGGPIIGTVTVKGSAGSVPLTRTVTIAADGKYTVDVSGMVAPFMLNASGTVGGTSYSLHSAAVSTDVNGNINITPLTDLIVANVAGQIASTYFASGNFSTLTAAELTAQETALQARIQDVLNAVPGGGVAASIDLLRSSFAADHTGLDAALDVLRVDIVAGTATITNIISNQTTTDNIASTTDAIVAVGATGVGTGLTELQQIVAGFDAFSAKFATSLPAFNDAALLALFDTTFLFDGANTAAFLSEITSDPTLVGVKFTNIALVPGSMLPVNAPTTAKVNFSAISGGNIIGNFEFSLNKISTAWKMAGNGRIASADVISFARLQDVFINNVQQTNYIDTGLTAEIKTPSVAGLASINVTPPAGAGYYAIVTGAGLPVAGALYVDDGTGNSMRATSAAPTAYTGVSTPSLNTFGHNQYPLADNAIVALADNTLYTIKIYHDNATAAANAMSDDLLLATYTSNAGKRPYLNSELTVASFAAITAPSKTALTAFANAGGTTTVTWTLPTATPGAKSRSLHYFRSGGTGFDSTSVNLLATATTAPITMSSLATANIGALVANGINLFIGDNFNRELTTIYNGQ